MQPPLQPSYVLRGHSAPIHSLEFLRNNSRLISGDAEGWTILWDIITRRPASVWQPHKGAILGVGAWGESKIITHGRDSRLNVWQIRPQDEDTLSKYLPVEENAEQRPSPSILHSLQVNTINFCSFASCLDDSSDEDRLLIAVPSADEGSILVYRLPDESIVARIEAGKREQTGMLMALSIFKQGTNVTVAAAHEVGAVTIWQTNPDGQTWSRIVSAKIHTQPVLSIDLLPDFAAIYSSGADATVVKYPLDGTTEVSKATKHAGQQGLRVRSDGRVMATAGWDGRCRIYSTRKLEEVAVLKWHKDGCYATAFAKVFSTETESQSNQKETQNASKDTGMIVAQRRSAKARNTHWLALGSKDGKISLWDVF